MPSTYRFNYSTKINQMNSSFRAAQTKRTYFGAITEMNDKINEKAKQKRKQLKLNKL